MASSDYKHLTIPFTGGLDESVDPKVLPQGRFKRLERFRHEKGMRLRKTSKFTQVVADDPDLFAAADPIVRAPRRIAAHGDQLLVVDEDSIRGVAEDSSLKVRMKYVDRASPVRISKRDPRFRTRDTTATPGGSYAETNNFSAYAYVTTVVAVMVRDEDHNTVLFEQELFEASSNAPVVIADDVGLKIYVFYGVGTSLKYRVLDVTSIATVRSGFAAAVTLVSDRGGSGAWDVARSGVSAAKTWIVAYFKDVGGGNASLRINEYSAAFAALDNFESGTLGGSGGLALHARINDPHIYVVSSDGEVTFRRFDQALALQAGPTALEAGVNVDSCAIASMTPWDSTADPVLCMWWDVPHPAVPSSIGTTGTVKARTATSAASLGSTVTWYGAAPTHRPFTVSTLSRSHIYLPVISEQLRASAPHENTGLLLQLTGKDSSEALTVLSQPVPLCAYARGQVPSGNAAEEHLPEVFVLSTGYVRMMLAVDVVGRPHTSGPSTFVVSEEQGADLIEFDFRSTLNTAMQPLRVQDQLVFSGGMPWLYDGAQLTELGFLHSGQLRATVTPASTGGNVPGGIFQYKVVPEWIDRRGRRHQGAPSPALTADLSDGAYAGGTNTITTECVPHRHTLKSDAENAVNGGYFVWYRTKAGPGSIFYRCELAAGTNWPANAPTSASGISFTDTGSDAAIGDNEVLYTDFGQLNHTFAPASEHITVHDDRVAGIDSEYRTRIWLTAPFTPSDGPAHNDTFQIYVEGHGDLTALASMDGKLYAFTRDAIVLAMYGDGPDATGGGQPFPVPQLLTREAGCIDARGIVVGPQGIYFAGPYEDGVGIFLWQRGDGGIVNVGAAVQDSLATIHSAVHLPELSQVRFVTAEPAILCYDYSAVGDDGLGTWSKIPLAVTSVDSLVQNGRHVLAYQSGDDWVHEQDSSDVTASDAIVETGDIWPAGIMSHARVDTVNVLGELVADRDFSLKLEASYDNGANYKTEDSVIFNKQPTDAVGAHLLRRWAPRRQRLPHGCVRYRITVSAKSGSVPDVALNALMLEWLPEAGAARVGADRRTPGSV